MCFATTTIPVRNFLSTLKLLKRPLRVTRLSRRKKNCPITTKKHYHWVLQPMKMTQNWKTGIFHSNSVQIIMTLASLSNILHACLFAKIRKAGSCVGMICKLTVLLVFLKHHLLQLSERATLDHWSDLCDEDVSLSYHSCTCQWRVF